MPTLKAMFRLMDNYSSQINKMMKSTDSATSKMLETSKAADKVNDSTTCAGDGFDSAVKNTKKFNDSLGDTASKARQADSSLTKLIRTVASFAAIKKGMDITDEYVSSTARLNLVNDQSQTPAELQQKVFDAANRSRGNYTDMASAASKMNLLAGDSFNSNDEAIAFTELLQKSLKVSGAGASEQQSVFLQLTQAMAAGKLQGDEFRSVMENAPMIADAIAQYLGKTKGELKELSSEGLITADIIKAAMFEAGADIESKFAEMPMTFADMGSLMGNNMMQSFVPVMENINALLNSAGIQEFMNLFNAGVGKAASSLNKLIDVFVQGNPIIKAFFATAIVMAGIWAVKMLFAAVASLMAHWPLLLIIGIIGAIIIAVKSMGGTFSDIFGFIGGLIGGFYAFVYNIMAGIWNIFIAVAEFIANIFTSPVAAIVNLFVNMATSILNIVEGIAKAIDNVFGTSLADGVGGLSKKLKDWGDSFKDDNYVSLDHLRMENKDIAETSDQWFDKGASIGSFLDDWDFGQEAAKEDSIFNYDDFASAGNPAIVEGPGGTMEVSMADEDIQYLRDLAQRDYVAKVANNTLAPNIRVEFSGPITKEADVEQIKGVVEKTLSDDIAVCAEGVY